LFFLTGIWCFFVFSIGERSGAPSANQAPPLIAFSDKKLGMGIDSRQSPPKAVVDSSPLQPQMDKNKECKYNNQLINTNYKLFESQLLIL
jgi:hypothetical protein